MVSSFQEIIKNRRSVRTFDGAPIRAEHLEAMRSYLSSLENPFDVPVDFRLLDAAEHGLTSAVIVGANTYLCAKVERVPNFEMAFGYSFEKACLHALTLGLGTVMLASTLSRGTFEKALEVRSNEVMPVASPIGYPAEKMSIREGLMRAGIKADTRKPFESLYYSGDFSTSLKEEDAGCYRDALESARWAPSAANVQPWRAVVEGESVHFFETRTMRDNPLGDIQKVDIGIMLAHFEGVLQEQGITGTFTKTPPAIDLPDKTEYMITFQKQP